MRRNRAPGSRFFLALLAGALLAFLLGLDPSLPLHAAPTRRPSPAPPSSSARSAPAPPAAPASPAAPVGPITPFPVPSASPSPAPLPLDVRGVLSTALQNSPTLLGSLDQVRIAHCKISEAYIPVNPTFSISSLYYRQLAPAINNTTFNPIAALINAVVPGSHLQTTTRYTANYDNYQLTASLQQTIYTFGKLHWTVAAARLAEKQAKQDYRTSVETLLQQVETGYVQVLLAQEHVEIARDRLERRISFVEMAKNQVRAGLVAEYDVMQYQSNADQAALDLASAESDTRKKLSSLLVLIGLPPGVPCVLAPLPAAPAPPASPEEGLAHALRHRPEMASQEWAVRAALAQVKVAGLTSAPSVSLFSQYTGLNDSLGNLTDQWFAGAQLTIPIADGGQARIMKREALAAVDQARQQLEQNRRTVMTDVAQAWIDLDLYYRQLGQARVSVDRARETLRIAALRYREALSSPTDLLNAQDTYINARQALATTEYNYYLAQVNWRRAISADHPVPLPASLRVDWELPPTPGGSPSAAPVGSPGGSPTGPSATPAPKGGAR